MYPTKGKVLSFNECKDKIMTIRELEEKRFNILWERRFGNFNFTSEDIREKVKGILNLFYKTDSCFCLFGEEFVFWSPGYFYCLHDVINPDGKLPKYEIRKKVKDLNEKCMSFLYDVLSTMHSYYEFDEDFQFIKTGFNKDYRLIKGKDGILVFDKEDVRFMNSIVEPDSFLLDEENEVLYSESDQGFAMLLGLEKY